MKSLSKIIDQLEVKYFKVSRKLSDLSKKNKMLTEALASSDIKLKDAQNRILSLESEIDKLRTANSLLGSGKNKKETKLKINAIIKQIDSCIDQLKKPQ